MANLEQTRQAWDECAEAYDRALTATDARAAEAALRLAGVHAGMRLLDIAAGPGALSIPAARLGAHVLAIDYSRRMIELLEHKARRLGLPNLIAQQMDGTALELEDGSVDVACSELGIMLFPDRARGLREMARVVRPGGRGVMVVLGPPQRVQPIATFMEAATQAVPGFSPPTDSPLFCLQDPIALRREMEASGFHDVEVMPFEDRMDVESPAALWDSITAGAPAVAGLLGRLSEEARLAVRRRLLDLIHSRFGGGAVSLPMAFNIAVGLR